MALTLEQIDRKIVQTEKVLQYWKRAREVVADPLFAELSPSPEESGTTNQLTLQPPTYPIENGVLPPQAYGKLKRLTLACLPSDGEGICPKDMVKLIQDAGYIFSTKTPAAISVNEALSNLKKEGKARIVGKASNYANLWLSISDTEKEATVATS
jgi:hypothetical protein